MGLRAILTLGGFASKARARSVMGTDTLEKLRSAAMDELDAFAAREPERALELKVRSVNGSRVGCAQRMGARVVTCA